MNTADQKRREAIAARIQKLMALSQSEASVGNETASENAWAMAQTLLAKHSVDEELLRIAAKGRGEKTSEPGRFDYYLEEGPNLRSRCQLASWVGAGMGLHTRLAHSGAYVVYVGFPEDAKAAWEMFQLIEGQMVASCARRIKRGEHHWEGVHAKTWKINYYEAYGYRVQQRLTQVRLAAAEEVVVAEGMGDQAQTGRVTGALVLRGRRDVVDAKVKELFPAKLKQDGSERKRQGSSWKAPKAQAWVEGAREAGREDGRRARIRQDSTLASRRAIR